MEEYRPLALSRSAVPHRRIDSTGLPPIRKPEGAPEMAAEFGGVGGVGLSGSGASRTWMINCVEMTKSAGSVGGENQ